MFTVNRPIYYIDMEDGKRFFQTAMAPSRSGAEGEIYVFSDDQGKKYAVKKIVSLDRSVLERSKNEMKFIRMLNGYCGRRASEPSVNKNRRDFSSGCHYRV